MMEQGQLYHQQMAYVILGQSVTVVQNFPSSNVQTMNEATVPTGTQTETTTGYAVITNDIVMSNLIVVTSFGLVIVVITTKARAVERS
jgi:hypothetical protein